MVLTALASVGAIFAGKSAAKRGESIQKINHDFHQQYRDDYQKKQLELDAKKQKDWTNNVHTYQSTMLFLVMWK